MSLCFAGEEGGYPRCLLLGFFFYVSRDPSLLPRVRLYVATLLVPMGGVKGLAVAFGGSVEYQGNNDPHFHGNVHVATVYQHKTLLEITRMMEENLLSVGDVTDYQEGVCREDHFDLDQHNSALPELEQSWNENNKGPSCDSLCALPAYIQQDGVRSQWSVARPLSAVEALADGAAFKASYQRDAQHVFSHCHHHWHPVNPHSRKREPIRRCRSKHSAQCKADFPKTNRLNLLPKVVCPGNCRRHGLRVSGRRNALGSILGRRRCEWL